MTDEIRLLKEIIQSSNINFLIGAGISTPFLPILGDIEKNIDDAKGDKAQLLINIKRYFNEVMYPCISILNSGQALQTEDKANFDATYAGYTTLFNAINRILLSRKGSLLNKQANIFTTNIDVFMEKVLEDLNLEYNDGFSGNINPVFQNSNFHKSIHKTSAHFGNVSEIPTFNIIKLHGSLAWESDPMGEKILYSRLKLVEGLKKVVDDDAKFLAKYENLQIVNPSSDKFKQTVMRVTYYELLRMYSSELERENSVLFVMGFSMADDHIREITKRVANSNPTLKIYIYSFSGCKEQENCVVKTIKDKCSYHKYSEWFGSLKYKNVEILALSEGAKLDVNTIVADYLEATLESDTVGSKESTRGNKSEENPELSR